MIVDTSALVAVMLQESGSEDPIAARGALALLWYRMSSASCSGSAVDRDVIVKDPSTLLEKTFTIMT